MKQLITLTFFLCCGLVSLAQLVTPFSVRYQATQKGGIRFISNGILSCGSGGTCVTARSQVPPNGTSMNNDFNMSYIDIDGISSTFSSSSDSLALPSCSQISWAGLYWAGFRNTGQANYANRFSVKLGVNNGPYSTITALTADRQDNSTGYTSYHAFADVTSIVQAAGVNARFTVADQFSETGGTNKFGGWTLVVVYKNDLQPMRNLTVFNGLGVVSSNNTVNIPISGFLTPLSGPVTFELGVVAYDGDRGQVGDQLLFNGGNGFVNISDALHSQNDIFNSSIAYNATLTPYRLPSFNNTLGHDANIFIPNNTAKNYIGNSATSATIRVTTGGETILQHVITSAIDVYEPDLRSAVRVSDLNGGLVEPGDVLEYTVVGKNIGSDPSVNTFITDTIERNAVYVPGSLQITSGPNAGAKSDASGDDQGEYIAANRVVRVRIGTGANGISGGQVNNSPAGIDSTVFKFRVMAGTDCLVLQCDNVIDNQARITGTGNVSGNQFTNSSNPDIFDGNGCPIPGTTSTPVSTTTCTAAVASSNTPVCPGSAIELNIPSSPLVNYAWSGPAGFTSAIYNPVISNATAANAGTYSLVVTVPGSSCNIPLSANVVVSTLGCTLPVRWVSFTAVKNGAEALLQWKTASELNTARFTVQHSADGISFATIASLPAAGNSNTLRSYDFTHTTPLPHINFYRIEQVDLDGQKSYSGIRQLNFNGNSSLEILVNPPVSGRLQVRIKNAGFLNILNASGQVIIRKQVSPGVNTIDINGFARGVYLLQSGTDTKKFIIE